MSVVYIDQEGKFIMESGDFQATLKVGRNEFREGYRACQFYLSGKKRVHKFIPLLFVKAIVRKYSVGVPV
jgi:hypothetical protein